MGSLRRFLCTIQGHEEYLRFEPNRMYLQCVDCGRETPGWTINSRRPALTFAARRPPVRPLSLAHTSTRKIA